MRLPSLIFICQVELQYRIPDGEKTTLSPVRQVVLADKMKPKPKSKSKSTSVVPPTARQLARERRERANRLAMTVARHAGYRYRSADVQPAVEEPLIFDNYQEFVLDATQMRRMQRYKRQAIRKQMGD